MIIPSSRVVYVWPMPATEQGVWDKLRAVADLSLSHQLQIRAVLEQVGGYTGGDKGKSGMGSNMFTFGAGYGALRMGLVALGLREGVEWVTAVPQRWQPRVGSPKKGPHLTKAQHKKQLAELAKSLFPGSTFSRETADSLLLAFYAQLRFTGRSD